MDRIASVVTGGGRGIGRAVALALARDGHAVCVNDTGVALDGTEPDPVPAEAVVSEIRVAGGAAIAVTADARTPAGAHEVVAGVAAWAGTTPSVLVHAAGTLRDAMVHKATDADWAEVLGSHLAVGIELTRAMAGGIRRSGYGRIVYVGGAAGLVGNVGQAAYAVAKAGLFGLTRAVALEMAGKDVCVNYVAPFAFTRMTESIPPVTEQLRAYLRHAPESRPKDVATFIAWLSSPAATGVTGQVFGVRAGNVSVWSQPRPVGPFDEASLTPLESEFDVVVP